MFITFNHFYDTFRTQLTAVSVRRSLSFSLFFFLSLLIFLTFLRYISFSYTILHSLEVASATRLSSHFLTSSCRWTIPPKHTRLANFIPKAKFDQPNHQSAQAEKRTALCDYILQLFYRSNARSFLSVYDHTFYLFVYYCLVMTEESQWGGQQAAFHFVNTKASKAQHIAVGRIIFSCTYFFLLATILGWQSTAY